MIHETKPEWFYHLTC